MIRIFKAMSVVCALVLAASVQAQETKFTVGVSLPLSGDAAECGVAVRNAITLAQEEISERLKHITFVYEDNRYDAKTTIVTVNKLAEIDKAQLLLVWGDVAAAVAAPIVERRRLASVVVSTDPRPFQNTEYIVRFLNSYDEYTQAMLAYLRGKNVKTIGIVHVDDPYYVSMIEALRRNLRADEGLEVVANHAFSDMDYKSTITNLRARSFDAVGVYLMPGQVSSFYRQLRALGAKVVTFGADAFESRTEIRDADGAMDGAVYAHNVVNEEFRQRYIARFGNDLQIPYAANAYEFARIIGDRFGDRVGRSLDAEGIIDAIRKVPKQDGAAGTYTVELSPSQAPYFKFPIAIKEIWGDTIRIVGK